MARTPKTSAFSALRVPRGGAPDPARTPKFGGRPALDQPIAWNFSRMDPGGKFACSLKKLDEFVKKLVAFEGKTIEQIMSLDHNHPLSTKKLSSIAKNRVEALRLDSETLYQLNLGTPVRLWGILEHNIFHVIWLDREHAVYDIGR